MPVVSVGDTKAKSQADPAMFVCGFCGPCDRLRVLAAVTRHVAQGYHAAASREQTNCGEEKGENSEQWRDFCTKKS